MSTDTDIITGIIKFGNLSNGRDKIFRLIQYGCKLVYWHMNKHGLSVETIPKLKQLETSMSMARKLLRFGKSLDFVQGALKTIHHPDAVIRMTVTMSKLNQACYLIFDHMIYLHNIGLINTDKKKWSAVSSRFWLFSLVLNLVRNFYDIYCIILKEMEAGSSKKSNGNANGSYANGRHSEQTAGLLTISRKLMLENVPVMLDLLKNVADFFLPLNSLEKVKLNSGTQGLVGVISSIVAIITLWNPRLKLVPS